MLPVSSELCYLDAGKYVSFDISRCLSGKVVTTFKNLIESN